MHSSRRRAMLLLAGAAAVVALAFAVPWFYANVIADDAPDAFDLTEPSADEGGRPIDVNGTWVVSAGSEAGYRVDEVLNSQDVTVVGRTTDVTGEFSVADGILTDAGVVVDMTTVTTDSSARDGQFATSIMQTSRYPEATFTLTEPIDIGMLGDGSTVDTSAAGRLTIRDATIDVDVDVRAQATADGVEVVGSIPITFADLGIEPPDLGFVKVEDHGLVEFRLALSRS